MTVSKKIKTEIRTIGPREAHRLLSENTHNRVVSLSKVEAYAGAIDRDEWMFNGDAIRIAEDGALLDGQHRLLAVVKVSKPIITLVVSGLPRSAQETMDTGRKRTFADMLRLRGEKCATMLSGTTNLLYNYSKTGTLYAGSVSIPPTAQELMQTLERFSDLRDHLYPPQCDHARGLLTPSVSIALYYLFAKTDKADADEFFRLLGTGDGLSPGHPIYALRERLIKERAKAQGRISPTVRAALTVKAFNAWREGNQVFTLKWTGGGGRAENFPRVAGCPIVPEADIK